MACLYRNVVGLEPQNREHRAGRAFNVLYNGTMTRQFVQLKSVTSGDTFDKGSEITMFCTSAPFFYTWFLHNAKIVHNGDWNKNKGIASAGWEEVTGIFVQILGSFDGALPSEIWLVVIELKNQL